MSAKKISTSQLAKCLSIPTKQMFGKLVDYGYLAREKEQWCLTKQGKEAGGELKDSKRFGQYIVWPVDLSLEGVSQENMLSSTALGVAFELSARRVNQILSEHGWIKKHLKGWLVTALGLRVGGEQREASSSGVPYVVWPSDIINNTSLVSTIKELKGEIVTKGNNGSAATSDKSSSFRDKFIAQLRAADGHFVRSRAEMLIDNWLYTAEIVHAYERRLPIEEEAYCDFYLPSGKVYIEFWGLESDEKYRARKQKKIDIYNQYGFNLIELHDKDIRNLDDILPKLLLKFDITTY